MTTTIKFNPNYIDLVSEILMDVCPGIFIAQIKLTISESKLANVNKTLMTQKKIRKNLKRLNEFFGPFLYFSELIH